jgi:MscS family membrane protein
MFIGHCRAAEIVIRHFNAGNMLICSWVLIRLCDLAYIRAKHRWQHEKADFSNIITIFWQSCRIFIVVVSVLLVLNCFGISIAGIFATLGIGGAIVAFAAKDSLTNLFCYISLILDKTFRPGDWIVLKDGNIEGKVEHIGLRSTKILTGSGTRIIAPNSLLSNEFIDNWAAMKERRVRQIIAVSPTTTAGQLRVFANDVESILLADSEVNHNSCFCAVNGFALSSIQLLVHYFTKPIDLSNHMRVQHRINCNILEAASLNGIHIATPLEMHQKFDVGIAHRNAVE